MSASPIAAAANYSIAVAPSRSIAIPVPAGEAQSTVVAAGKKTQCPNGSVVFTNDQLRPEGAKVVTYVDVGTGLTGGATLNGFARLGATAHIGWNDHDILAMPNGDVLLFWGDMDGSALPGGDVADNLSWWWPYTFRSGIGPGVRTSIVAWKSTDCGRTFFEESKLDPAAVLDGHCAWPQPLRDGTFPQPSTQRYDMGGTDGPQISELPTGRLVLSMLCGGSSAPMNFYPKGKPLNKQLIAYSDDEAGSWHTLGYIDTSPAYGMWRSSVALLQSSADPFLVAVAMPAWVDLLSLSTTPSLFLKTTAIPFSGAPAQPFGAISAPGPDQAPSTEKMTGGRMHTNIFANPVLTTIAPNTILVAVPMGFTDNGSASESGYQIFTIDAGTQTYNGLPPVVPKNPGANDFIMHLTLVNCGDATLMYWIDVDGDNATAEVLGRFILGPTLESEDIPLSVGADFKPALFDFQSASSWWFGDYHTAGCLHMGSAPSIHDRFFPIWVQADSNMHIGDVSLFADPFKSRRTGRLTVGATAGSPLLVQLAAHPIAYHTVDPKTLRLGKGIAPRHYGIEDRGP